MRHARSLAAALIVITSTATARADEERPSKGTGFLVTGAVFSGVGAATLIGTPSICATGSGTATTGKSTTGCKTFGFVLGAAFLGVGIPLIVIGAVKRANYNTWREAHPIAAGLHLAPLDGGAGLGWRASF